MENLLKQKLDNSKNPYLTSYSRRYSEWKRRQTIAKAFKNFVAGHNGTHINVLEVGCGEGTSSFQLQNFFKDNHNIVFTGTDISTEAVQFANLRVSNEQIDNCKFVVADANKLPFQQDQFDIVISSEVIEHMEDPAVTIAESFRVLKAGGEAIFTTPNGGVTPLRRAAHVLDALTFHLFSAGRRKVDLSDTNMVTGPAVSGLMEENLGFGHISVYSYHRWKTIFIKAGFEVIDSVGTGGLLLGMPSLDMHRIFFASTLVADAIIDHLPLSHLCSENLQFELRKPYAR